MDWLNIIIGLIFGGGGVSIIFWKKLKGVEKLVLDIERLIAKSRKMVDDWKKANEDHTLSADEVKSLLEDVDAIVKRTEAVVDDYEKLRRG